jgi:hypothetical protein
MIKYLFQTAATALACTRTHIITHYTTTKTWYLQCKSWIAELHRLGMACANNDKQAKWLRGTCISGQHFILSNWFFAQHFIFSELIFYFNLILIFISEQGVQAGLTGCCFGIPQDTTLWSRTRWLRRSTLNWYSCQSSLLQTIKFPHY